MKLKNSFQNLVAAARQSAANSLPQDKECGARPRRRYASEVLRLPLEIQRFAVWVALMAISFSALAAEDSQTSAEKVRNAISILKSSTEPAQKAMTCKWLAVYGNQDAVPALSPLLADPQLSSWARIALEVIPGPAADAALRDAMSKVQGKLLVGVINSIGVRHDAKAVNGLIAKLKEADVEVASAAAVALGRIGGDRAAGALEQALANSTLGIRSAAAQGCILCAEHFLAEKKSAKATRLYDTLRKTDLPKQRILEATRGAILARQSDGLPLLLETLRSSDQAIFGIGLRTARELPGRAVTEALAAELGKSHPDRQGPLFLALADRNDAAVLPAVLATAQSGPKNLRLVAIGVMVRLGNFACVPVLLDAVAESDAELVQAAKAALAGLPGKEVDDRVAARLPQVTGNTRRALVEIAGQRHVAAALPELLKAANDTDHAMRAAGVRAVGESVNAADLGALTDLLARAKTDEEVSAVQAALESACARIPDKAACAARLLPHLSTAPISAKCALLRVLGVVTTATALDAVRSSVASPQPAERDMAIRVLADWPDAPALPALLDVLRTSEDESHRFLALRGCVRLLDLSDQSAPDKVKTYAELVARTQRADDRKAILSGLANVADPAALKLAEPFLNDAQVQAEAELAVLKIAGAIMKSAPAEAKAAAARLKAESKNQATRDGAAKILNRMN
jgi:HEAT repeat protein